MNFRRFIEEANKLEKHRILELGSRNITGNMIKPYFRESYTEYVGFDIHPGQNVDVVGDVHQLSRYFSPESFDVVFCLSVFEHLAMPWKAVVEINKVMRTGGLLHISTHPTWPAHELPWDFWRFSAEAFTVLLNPITGFRIINCVDGLPCAILPFGKEPAMAGLYRQPARLGVSVLATKCGSVDERLAWDISPDEILTTMYPKQKNGTISSSLTKLGA
jgi:SAM-dependent methyltransferase